MFPSLSRRDLLAHTAAIGAASLLPAAAGAAVTLSADHARAPRSLGNPSAEIVIKEFFSMTCGHCGRFHQQTYPKVKSQLIDTGIIRFELHPFPLDGLALRAHALCRALPETSYFAMVNLLLKEQKMWVGAEDPIAALRGYGRKAGVSQEEFDSIMSNRDFLQAIFDQREEANKRFEVSSTPSFIANDTHRFSGAVSYDKFVEELEKFGV